MLRTLAAALLVANLVFFVWAHGWLSPAVPPPHHGEREPERLAAQWRPQTVRVLTPQAASAALTACVEAGPFSEADIAGAEAAIAAAGVPGSAWARVSAQPPASWLVYMGRFADPALLRIKEAELRRLKLSFDEVRAPAELAPGLALMRHDSREAAEAGLAELAARGVHSARVVALPPPAQFWLRAAEADAALRARLQALGPALNAAAFSACAPRP